VDVAREHGAAGARRGCAAQTSTRAGSVEEAHEPEHLEGSLAHLTLGIICSEPDHWKSEARQARLAHTAARWAAMGTT
jgi:hypothetical protein